MKTIAAAVIIGAIVAWAFYALGYRAGLRNGYTDWVADEMIATDTPDVTVMCYAMHDGEWVPY